MRRNLFVAMLVPVILTCILIFMLIWDSRKAPASTQEPGSVIGDETGISPTPAITITSIPTPSLTPAATPTPVPTAAPSTRPTSAPSPTAAATPVPTPVTPTTTPAPQPSEGNNGSSGSAGNQNGGQGTEPQGSINIYKAIYTQEGDDYTLVADGITGSYLVISKKDNSIRQTGYKYSPRYEENAADFPGPMLGYKNRYFVFAAGKQIVASDGVSETILKTFGDEINGDPHITMILQSENRILAGLEGTILMVVDCRVPTAEAYSESYNPDYAVLTDEYLCFSRKMRIPAGPYYNYIYTAKSGNKSLLGSIGEIDEFSLENNTVNIKSYGNLFQINLETNTLTSSLTIGSERTLYFPVYGDGIIQDLSEIRFINHNGVNKQAETIQLPDFLKAECYYNTYYNLAIFSLYYGEKAGLLPNIPFGTFAAIDYTVFPLEDRKFPPHSTLKEKLYSGNTRIGEGEIFLLEKSETKDNASVLFEIVYAWIPVEGESRAFQLYVYVPQGENKDGYVNLVKQLLKIGD